MEKYALITGASSGLGYLFSIELNKKGYTPIIVARNKDKLIELSKELTNSIIYDLDLSNMDNIKILLDEISKYKIEVFINNAGFGECNSLLSYDVSRDLNMIDLNCKALTYLSKEMARVMSDGYILNVSSMAGILRCGPYMATYYATKAYVQSFTKSLQYEMKKEKKKLNISILSPGPIKTNFFKNAGSDADWGINPYKVVKYALKKLFKKKKLIIPSFSMRAGRRLLWLVPEGIVTSFVAKTQKNKQ